ncbi:MFS transporter [Gordonia liuliyuniae]|uniref:MFS transporter n=1 Tax=Gordonia liuliyuniae TaxID=2911517 RepID=A0ABS9ITC8_9ACTN|nr:MFS transporter [Gordonia liuliyuniae]MCF8588760.1 MFS transporter [Gordonia liuliyuniae]
MSVKSEATTPPEIVDKPRPRTAVVAAVACAGIFVGYLPIMAATVGLSAIAQETRASASDLEWVVSMLVLPMAALILAFGAWAEKWGRRRVLVIGLVLAMLGGLVATSAGLVDGDAAIYFIWIGQGIAGMGAAALIPTTLAIISVAEPDHRRRAVLIAAWSGAMMAAMAVAVYISAAILDVLAWYWLFIPVVVASALVLAFGVRLVPESRGATSGRMDVPGQILTAVGVAALVYAVIVGGADGFSSPKSITGLVVAVVAIAGFIVVELRSNAPLLDLRVFSNVNFSMSALVAAIAMFAYLGVNFGLALYFSALELSPIEVANRYIFLIGGSVVGSNIAGRALHRFNAQSVLAAACGWTGLAMVFLSFIDADAPVWQADLRLILTGVGIGGVLATVTAAAVNAVPYRQAGMASAAINAVRQTGGALGPAVFSILSASWALSALPDKLFDAGIDEKSAAVVHEIVDEQGVQHGGAVAQSQFPELGLHDALSAAQAHGFSLSAVAAAIVFCILAVSCAVLRVVGRKPDVEEPVQV